MNAGWLYVAGTIVFTVYGQLVVKWQVGEAGDFPEPAGEKIQFLLRLLLRPWVISALLVALLGALCWMAALTRFDLSRAYPFMALSFVLVMLGSAALFSESLTVAKVTGIALICLGLVVGSR